jgi:hypothetical protein
VVARRATSGEIRKTFVLKSRKGWHRLAACLAAKINERLRAVGMLLLGLPAGDGNGDRGTQLGLSALCHRKYQ